VKRLALAVLVTLSSTLVPSWAIAQVSVQSRAAGRPFEVGQAFQLEVNAMGSGQETPDDPRLPVPPGFEVRGPSIGTRTQFSVVNGTMTQQSGISATWTVIGSRPGSFKLGPPSVRVGNRRETGNVVVVQIVPKGTLPRSQGGRPSIDPFGMFDPFGTGSGFPPGFFGQDPRLLEPDEPPPVPEELRVAEAPDPVAFVRAVLSPKQPVVGEQVTLRIFAYGSRGTFRESSPTEASRADFLSYSVVEGLPGEDFVRVPIGDTTFYAVKIRDDLWMPFETLSPSWVERAFLHGPEVVQWKSASPLGCFAKGDLAGWTVAGESFAGDPSPVTGRRGRLHPIRRCPGGWILDSRAADPAQPATGSALSPSFRAPPGSRLELWLGGIGPGVGVRLRKDAEILAEWPALDPFGISPERHDLSPWDGQDLQLEVFDDSGEAGGYVLVGDVVLVVPGKLGGT